MSEFDPKDYPPWLALKVKMIAKRLLQHPSVGIKSALEMIYSSTEYELLADFATGYWEYFPYDSYCIIAEDNNLIPIPYNEYKGIAPENLEILNTLLQPFEEAKAELQLDLYHYYRPYKILVSLIDSESWKGKGQEELKKMFLELLRNPS